jgi:hypothetical protein
VTKSASPTGVGMALQNVLWARLVVGLGTHILGRLLLFQAVWILVVDLRDIKLFCHLKLSLVYTLISNTTQLSLDKKKDFFFFFSFSNLI